MAFDDLVQPPATRRTTTRLELSVAGLVAQAIRELEKDPPTLLEQVAAAIALHTCARCEQLADKARDAGEPVPPVALAESWYGPSGRRYFGATCRACTDWEWARMWQRRYDLACGKGEGAKMNIGEQRRLTELVHARQRSGRMVPVNLPPAGDS